MNLLDKTIMEIKYEVFVLHEGKWATLGIFEMAPGRDMDSQTLTPYGTYEEQAKTFQARAEREYGKPIKLVEVKYA